MRTPETREESLERLMDLCEQIATLIEEHDQVSYPDAFLALTVCSTSEKQLEQIRKEGKTCDRLAQMLLLFAVDSVLHSAAK